jgi:hypothetical protein
MSGERVKRDGSSLAIYCAAAMVAVLALLYVLSAGPAILILSEDAWATVYFPLLMLAAYLPPIGNLLEWYMGFFVSVSESATG